MRHFIIASAVVGIVTLAAEAPASAEISHGTPIKQSGQCYRHHGVGSDHQFGSMETCPQPASNPTVSRPTRQRG
jgi:hypothetical protein